MGLFKSKWTQWEYVEDVVQQRELMANRYEDLLGNDPCDIGVISTGEFEDITYEVYKRVNLKTGLPQYKKVEKIT
jgi:hypothetical protein